MKENLKKKLQNWLITAILKKGRKFRATICKNVARWNNLPKKLFGMTICKDLKKLQNIWKVCLQTLNCKIAWKYDLQWQFAKNVQKDNLQKKMTWKALCKNDEREKRLREKKGREKKWKLLLGIPFWPPHWSWCAHYSIRYTQRTWCWQ